MTKGMSKSSRDLFFQDLTSIEGYHSPDLKDN